MKRFFYLTMILLTFAVVGCEKEETPEPQQQTLEQLYPDWKNLTWEATYRNSDNASMQYPRLEIKIVGDVVTISSQMEYEPTPISNTYNKITITGNHIRFDKDYDYTFECNFEKSNGKMIINNGLPSLHRYVLKIN